MYCDLLFISKAQLAEIITIPITYLREIFILIISFGDLASFFSNKNDIRFLFQSRH